MNPWDDNDVLALKFLSFKLQLSDMEMDMNSYGKWYKAIITDNIDLTYQILRQRDLQKKKKLLDGYFAPKEQNIDNLARKYLGYHSLTQCQRSLTLAFVFGSRQTLAAMLENGADPLTCDKTGDTILHNVIAVASSYPDTEADLSAMYTYFMHLLTPEQQKVILYKENALGLRPLEEAAQKGCVTLLKTIFMTPGELITLI